MKNEQSNLNNDEQWPDLLDAYFGNHLSDKKAKRWWDELTSQISDLSNAEVCEAIRHASRQERSKYAGKPTLKDLRIWIFVWRKETRDDGPIIAGDCACSEGWVLWYNGEDYYPVAIPCYCKEGKRLRAKLGLPFSDPRISEAMQQEVERRAANTKLYETVGKENRGDLDLVHNTIKQLSQKMGVHL